MKNETKKEASNATFAKTLPASKYNAQNGGEGYYILVK